MAKGYKVTIERGAHWDPEAKPASLKAALQGPGDRRVRDGLKTIKRAGREFSDMLATAEKLGAGLPPTMQALSRSWAFEKVDPGAEYSPQWVVRFDGNSPVSRLSRASGPDMEPVLDTDEVAAAWRLLSLYARAVKAPRLTSSYEGSGGGARGPSEWVDVKSNAWGKLCAAMALLLPVERDILTSVCVFEESIESVAKRGVTPFKAAKRAEGGVTMLLKLGLRRLADHWTLDAGVRGAL